MINPSSWKYELFEPFGGIEIERPAYSDFVFVCAGTVEV